MSHINACSECARAGPLEKRPDITIKALRRSLRDALHVREHFPVDMVSLPYTVLWSAFEKIAADQSANNKDRLFRGPLSRYRLQYT